MLIVTIAGNLGKDAEYKQTQSGKGFCSFPVAATVGYGESKSTVWVDVTRWGEGAQGLSRHLRKGSKVTVLGELSTREHNGKTYLQCRADKVAIQGSAGGGTEPVANNDYGRTAPPATDLDDDSDIPF